MRMNQASPLAGLCAALVLVMATCLSSSAQINNTSGGGVTNQPGGGGSGSPAAPDYSLQYSLPGQTGFGGTSGLIWTPSLQQLTSTGIFQTNGLFTAKGAFENGEYNEYDPMNTAYAGGWANAILTPTTGHTPIDVLNAAINTAECNVLTGVATTSLMKIKLPPNYGVANITELKLWAGTSFGGDNIANKMGLQHTSDVAPMVHGHSGTDTLTCSNGVTYTPGRADRVYLHDFSIGGMGNSAGANDIGIQADGAGWYVENIGGFSNAFAGPAFLDKSFNSDYRNLGYVSAQLSGCVRYSQAGQPITQNYLGECGAIQITGVDNEDDWFYASDGIPGTTTTTLCYPSCAGIILGGSNSHNTHMFAQVSDVGIIWGGGGAARGEDWRVDATAHEGIIIPYTNLGSTLTNVVITSPCMSGSLAASYNAGNATGCGGIQNNGQGAAVTGVVVGSAPGIFGGPSYINAAITDGLAGGSSSPNQYAQLSYVGNPTNTTSNDLAFAGLGGGFGGDHSSGRVAFPSMAPIEATGPVINVSGITSLELYTSTSVTALTNGIPGQRLTIGAGSGITASITPGSTITTNSGGVENIGANPMELICRSGGMWHEVQANPQTQYVHLNETGNYIPSSLSVVDFIGNAQAHPYITGTFTNQLAGPAVSSGQYTFIQEADFADGTFITGAPVAVTQKLSTLGGGEIFLVSYPQATQYKLWMITNTTGDGQPLGQILPTIPAASSSGAYWNYTAFTSGGNSATAPASNVNNTGTYLAPNGITLNTTAAKPTCDTYHRGWFWNVYGNGTSTADTLQVCALSASGTYGWITH